MDRRSRDCRSSGWVRRHGRRAAPKTSKWQTFGRSLLGFLLANAGISHLTYARQSFQAQVPPWIPLNPDLVVILSGVAEITLGLALLVLYRHKAYVGMAVALFFVAIFPGNIAQYTEHRAAFLLTTDTARLVRLFFQPVLVACALWSTGAWRAMTRARRYSAENSGQ